MYDNNSNYLIYKKYFTRLLLEDIKNYNLNNDFHTLWANNFLQNKAPSNKQYNISIEDLNLSVRPYNCLKRAGINTVYDILKLDFEKLCNIRNIGKTSNEILEKLYELNILYPSFMNVDTTEYPLINVIKNIKLDNFHETTLNENTNCSEISLPKTTIDSFFDANLSPGLINILLMHGFTNFRDILIESDLITKIMNTYSESYIQEYQQLINKFTDLSVIIKLDMNLLTFMSHYKIFNLSELTEHSSQIEDQKTKDTVLKIINTINNYDLSRINDYIFMKDTERDSVFDEFDEQL